MISLQVDLNIKKIQIITVFFLDILITFCPRGPRGPALPYSPFFPFMPLGPLGPVSPCSPCEPNGPVNPGSPVSPFPVHLHFLLNGSFSFTLDDSYFQNIV
jgi:hypothetical protein